LHNNCGFSCKYYFDNWSVNTEQQTSNQRFFVDFRGHALCRFVYVLIFTVASAIGLFADDYVRADSAIAGLDPGFQSGIARQERREKRFYNKLPRGGVEYRLIAVAEQGNLQDSRPFEIVDLGIHTKESYLHQSADNVSPFYFGWNNHLGTNTSLLEIDTRTRPYFYRNDARLSSFEAGQSVILRDQARTIYHSIPADHNDPSLPQLKNSLDDHVHLALFQQINPSGLQTISNLSDLNSHIRLRVPATDLAHESNYQLDGSGQRVLKKRIGSRVMASILWSEDANADGHKEVYLVEINLGGRSNLPAWQTDDLCVADSDSHAHLISGQYLVLGASLLLDGTDFPLRDNQVVDLRISWGEVLEKLRSRQSYQPCQLEASLQHLDHSIALGVAIEGKGAVRQSLDVAAVSLVPDLPAAALPAVQSRSNNYCDRQEDGNSIINLYSGRHIEKTYLLKCRFPLTWAQ